MSSHRDALVALSRLKSGEAKLTSEQYLELLEAVEQAVQVLLLAPRGSDPVATGLWYNHERAPALVRLADALAPQAVSVTPQQQTPQALNAAPEARTSQQPSDREVLRELHQALLDKSSR